MKRDQPLFDKAESDNRALRAAIRSIDPAKLAKSVSKSQLATIKRYLEVLAFECSDAARRGQPSNRTLADRMSVSERTVQLVRSLAAELGLVRIEPQVCSRTGRQLSNWQTVDVAAIRAVRIGQETASLGGRNGCAGRAQWLRGEGAMVSGGGRNGCAPLTEGIPVLERKPNGPLPSWQQVENELAAEGVGEWQSVCDRLRDRVSPEHVLAIVEHYRRGKPGWTAGALFCRLRRAHASLAIADGWPPKSTPAATPRPPKIDRYGIQCDIARDWKREGRWFDATTAEIEAEIDRRLGIVSVGG